MSLELHSQHSGVSGISNNITVIADTVYEIGIGMNMKVNRTGYTYSFHFFLLN